MAFRREHLNAINDVIIGHNQSWPRPSETRNEQLTGNVEATMKPGTAVTSSRGVLSLP